MEVSRLELIFIIVVIFLVGFIAGLEVLPKIYKQETVYKTAELDETIIEVGLPAVDNNGDGVVAKLRTTVKPGSGLVLVNINDILANYDTQESGRIAVKVAGKYTSTNMSTLDVIYNIKANASIIEGPSAGVSMAASIILALRGESVKNILVTGIINEDGSIGKVGAIIEKAMAAKDADAEVFLVPEDQSTWFARTRDRECKMIGSIEYCKIAYISDDMNIGEIIDIRVEEVKNINDVMSYFIDS